MQMWEEVKFQIKKPFFSIYILSSYVNITLLRFSQKALMGNIIIIIIFF